MRPLEGVLGGGARIRTGIHLNDSAGLGRRVSSDYRPRERR